jgi:hypothetical protein
VLPSGSAVVKKLHLKSENLSDYFFIDSINVKPVGIYGIPVYTSFPMLFDRVLKTQRGYKPTFNLNFPPHSVHLKKEFWNEEKMLFQ